MVCADIGLLYILTFVILMIDRNKPTQNGQSAMQLLEHVASLNPDLDDTQLFRACHLLSVNLPASGRIESLEEHWREIAMRLQAAADQQAAVTEELEALARTDPKHFTPDQVWVLVKAIKVLSQLLSFYTRSS